jgi:hypothetical protein
MEISNLNDKICVTWPLSPLSKTEPWYDLRWARKTMASLQKLYVNSTFASYLDDLQVMLQPLRQISVPVSCSPPLPYFHIDVWKPVAAGW